MDFCGKYLVYEFQKTDLQQLSENGKGHTVT
jgi:hypothetical protein